MTDDQVIVIGSGPCGAIAASRLVERGVRVTMLDSGLSAPKGVIVRAAGNTVYRKVDEGQMVNNRHVTTSNPGVDWYSSLSHGGLSNYWTAAVPRFAPEDFTEGARVDDRFVWPIGYDDLIPHYERAEKLLEITAGVPFANIPANVNRFSTRLPHDWAELAARVESSGFHLGPLPMAKGSPWMAARRPTEFSSYHCVVAPLRASPRFELIPGAHVTRIKWSPTKGAVDAVDYFDRRTGQHQSVPCRAVVLAAGAIDSTVIMLRSTSGDFPAGLGNSGGLVGRYLHDHPREWWPAQPTRSMTALAHPAYLSRAGFEDAPALMATSLTFGLAAKYDRLRAYANRPSRTFGVQVFGTMIPTPDLGIRLPKDASVDGGECRPEIDLRYDQAAIDNLVSSRLRLQEMFGVAGRTVDIPGPFHAHVPGSSVHYGGTIRMHASSEFGVLDRFNRLHDAPNVVVCDSSCFTTGPEKNPTLTAMAIADRAADHLAADLGCRHDSETIVT